MIPDRFARNMWLPAGLFALLATAPAVASPPAFPSERSPAVDIRLSDLQDYLDRKYAGDAAGVTRALAPIQAKVQRDLVAARLLPEGAAVVSHALPLECALHLFFQQRDREAYRVTLVRLELDEDDDGRARGYSARLQTITLDRELFDRWLSVRTLPEQPGHHHDDRSAARAGAVAAARRLWDASLAPALRNAPYDLGGGSRVRVYSTSSSALEFRKASGAGRSIRLHISVVPTSGEDRLLRFQILRYSPETSHP